MVKVVKSKNEIMAVDFRQSGVYRSLMVAQLTNSIF